MPFKDISIQGKLTRIILLISGVVLLVTCIAFCVYNFISYRQNTLQKLVTLGKVIAANSTAAIAFDSKEDANEILAAFKTEPHIVAASLYDDKGNLFARYPLHIAIDSLPARPQAEGYSFSSSFLEGYQPVVQGSRHLGVLYIRSDLQVMYSRFIIYIIITISVFCFSLLLAYILSGLMQKYISKPILALAAKAKTISDAGDYSIRATKLGNDELGLLTDAFNQMLEQVSTGQKQISELNRDLEKKVMLRTSELESINNELESFSYSVSHDLRAPVRIIDGFTGILMNDYNAKLGEDGNRIAKVIVEQTKQMGQLIDDLLNFSRLGRASLRMQKVDSNLLVNSIVEQNFFSKQDPVPEIKMEVLPHIICDINLMRQVWLNLISNAIKYSSKKEKTIIEIGSFTKEDQIVFFIKDNGVGFDMKYANKLFGAFQRLHKQEEFSGTGIGLAIVQRIINKHAGSVWAQAEVDKGATFYFSLPQSPNN